MHFLASALSAIALLPASTLGAHILFNWHLDGGPEQGFTNVEYPISMPNAPHEDGFYFAQQFEFKNIKQLGYTGLQPRPDKNGNSIVHAVFSSFATGTTTDDPNCSSGADGSSDGASCAVDLPGDYSHNYSLYVENVSGHTWNGTIKDLTAGTHAHIGSYTLPEKAGLIDDMWSGFLEYYPMNSETTINCTWPYTEATFTPPKTSDKFTNAYLGTPAYDVDECKNITKYKTSFDNDGKLTITTGEW